MAHGIYEHAFAVGEGERERVEDGGGDRIAAHPVTVLCGGDVKMDVARGDGDVGRSRLGHGGALGREFSGLAFPPEIGSTDKNVNKKNW